MKKLFIKFSVDLCAYEDEIEGTIFHRWLPDGEKDSIELKLDDPNTKLKVWFERCGFTDDSFIRFSRSRREIEQSTVDKQGCLYSGPLYGLLEIENLPTKITTALKESRKGDEAYIKFTKSIIKNALYKPVNKFIESLRVKMGQYWIRPMPKYDSRTQSIGYYSGSILGMKWRFARGRKWHIVDPDGPDTVKATFHVGKSPDYQQYMDKSDWESLKQPDYKENNSDIFLLRSHRLCDSRDMRLAFIEGVTALELSIHEFIRERAVIKPLLESVESFYGLSLRSQLTVLCAAIGSIPAQQIELSIQAIKIRNQIVHDGFVPKIANETELYALLKIVSLLTNKGVYKFPSKQFHFSSMSNENWLKTYNKNA